MQAFRRTANGQLVEQIVARLSVGAAGRTLYQGDGGIFAWFDDPRQAFGNHLEALYALFRTPARVAGLSIDLTDRVRSRGRQRPLARKPPRQRPGRRRRCRSRRAEVEILRSRHARDASWKLSMLSQLDDAIDRGEVWVAYQPKLDLATRGSSAPKPSRAGPIPKRVRSRRPSSSPRPSSTIGSASSRISFSKKPSARPRRSTSAAAISTLRSIFLPAC